MPRLLFVSSSAYRLGGLATWLDYLLPGLRERGWDPVLGLLEGPRHNRPAAWLAEHPHESWISVPCRTGTPEGRCRAIVAAIEETRPAVVIGVNVPDAYSATARLRRREGSTVHSLMTIHGILPQLFEDVRRFSGVLDGVAGTNRLACALAVHLGGLASERVWYAPYGMELPETLPPPIEPVDRIRIGFVGRFDQAQKRVLDLPEISSSLDRLRVPHRWLLAGTGPEEQELRRALDDDRATFLGHVPQTDLADVLYREVDALIIPSSWETGPIVAWEAMREGVPVVSSRYVGSGLEAALQHDENALLFQIGDASGAARQLERLFHSPELREELRRGGLRLVRERYNRGDSVIAWDRCLGEVLARPPRSVETEPEVPRAGGRLGRWMSPGWAETVRRVLLRTAADSGPGGEWPHSYGKQEPVEEFLALVSRIDRGEAP